MKYEKWLICPVCGSKTRLKLREDTILENFPLYCPKCKQETLINAKQMNVTVIIEPDAQTQSRWTCEKQSLSAIFDNHGATAQLELGIVRKETLEGFQKIIKRMSEEEGIEAIILGCTELPLLLNDEVSPVPCLDTMKIHIQCLIDWIVK